MFLPWFNFQYVSISCFQFLGQTLGVASCTMLYSQEGFFGRHLFLNVILLLQAMHDHVNISFYYICFDIVICLFFDLYLFYIHGVSPLLCPNHIHNLSIWKKNDIYIFLNILLLYLPFFLIKVHYKHLNCITNNEYNSRANHGQFQSLLESNFAKVRNTF